MENLLGTVVKFDESNYTQSVRVWEEKGFPELKNLTGAYSFFALGELDEIVFRKIIRFDFKEFREKAVTEAERSMGQKSGPHLASLVKKEVESKIKQFEDLCKRVVDKMAYEKSLRTLSDLRIEWDDVHITDGKFIVDKETIKKHYSVTIDTEAKAELFTRLQQVQKEWNQLRDFLVDAGYDISRFALFGEDRIFCEESDGTLAINPESINFL